MSKQPEKQAPSRRDFLRTAALSAAAAAGVPAVAKSNVYSLAPARVLGAADRIRLGHIGVGVQGYGAHVRLLKENATSNNTEQVAVCDLYGIRNRRAGTHMGLSESAWYKNYKQLLERKDVDAVVIATADNWHAQIAVDAMNAGKHVYCEKPMCKTVDEAFAIYDTVKKTKTKFQIGSQGTSDPMYLNIQKIVKDGKIGQLVMGQHSYNRGDNRIGEWNSYGDNPYKAPKPGEFDHRKSGPTATGDHHIDWETYRKGAGPKEWDPDRFFRWRKYWAYGSGLVGDLMPHRLHPMYIAMGIPLSGEGGWPVRVSAGGVLTVQTKHPEVPGKPDRDVPDFTYTTVDFPEYSLIIMSTTVNEQGMRPMIRGNKGTIIFSGDSAQLTPERAYSDEIEAETIPLNSSGEPITTHQKNWLDCIRDGKEPNGNIDLAVRVQTVISLGELAYRNNQTYTWDPKTRSSTPSYKAAAVKPVPVKATKKSATK
jgi:predicted dehydrogenase